VADQYVLTAAEVEMLDQSCRTADELDRLERAVRALPELTTTGSTGQLKPHPLLAEVRAHRLLLERLTTALNLPDEDEDVGLRGRRGMRSGRLVVGGRNLTGCRRRRWMSGCLALIRRCLDVGDASASAVDGGASARVGVFRS
jgi:hypothetical protein